MALSTESLRFGDEQRYVGYAAWPERAQTPLPGIVVVQEAWGVNDHIEDVSRRFASAGYFALAPDLYAAHGVRPPELTRERLAEVLAFVNELPPDRVMDAGVRNAALAARPADAAKRIGASIDVIFAGTTSEAHVAPLAAAARYLRADHPVTRGQRVGSVGFCMGGRFAALLACADPELSAAVVFYGMPPREEQIARMGCAVLGCYGARDARVTDNVPAFAKAMKTHGRAFEYRIYENAGHAFFNDSRPTYDVSAARDAWTRTLDFFRRHLAPE
jgi:carboxymethylenebutenolidase